MSTTFAQAGDIARVRLVSSDRCRVDIEYRNGLYANATRDEPFDLVVGDIVVVRSQPWALEKVSAELWPEEVWVGVVRLRRDDITIVDTSGRLRRIPTSRTAYEEKNTVEGTDSAGVTRVLASDPIRFIDLPSIDDAVVQSFKRGGSTSESFDDFGGMKDVVARAREVIEAQLEYREKLLEIGVRPVRGVLFTGQPGTGKTMLARIIANNTDATFYEVSGPVVLSKWYGESEELLRKIFEDAERQPRAIIFFDEIDSLASQRNDESNEASRRVVAQLLTLMDGFTKTGNVVVIAATNRPQDIDVALRRPGRFDWEIHFDLPGESDRSQILRAVTRGIKVAGSLPHDDIARRTEGWSSAELSMICNEAGLLAAKQSRSSVRDEDYWGGFERVRLQRTKQQREAEVTQ